MNNKQIDVWYKTYITGWNIPGWGVSMKHMLYLTGKKNKLLGRRWRLLKWDFRLLSKKCENISQEAFEFSFVEA